MKFRGGRLSMYNGRRGGWALGRCSAISLLALGFIAGTWTAALAAGEHGSTTPPERSHAVETDSLFGFTEGSDTGDAGEREVSYQLTGRRLRGWNGYTAVDHQVAFEYGVRDDLKLGIGTSLDVYRFPRPNLTSDQIAASDEPNELLPLFHRRSIAQSLSGDLKYRLLERGPENPIGLALALEPQYRRVLDGRGFHTQLFQFETRLIADTALIPDRLFAAANLAWEPGITRTFEKKTARDTTVQASLALAGRVAESVFLGAEARYLGSFEGYAFRKSPDFGIFVGPTLYAKLNEKVSVSAAYGTRVGGVIRKAPEPVPDFGNVPAPAERHHLRVKVGYTF